MEKLYWRIGLIADIPMGLIGFGFGVFAWDDYDDHKRKSIPSIMLLHAGSIVGFYSVGVCIWPITPYISAC